MHADDVLSLGLGVTPPWKLFGQRLDTDNRPKELHIELAADRGARFPCPDCGRSCKAHDFGEFTWRHLNFFQHHCTITAKVPRTDCPDHGVKRIQVPWAREGSRFTLLFEQASWRARCRCWPLAAHHRHHRSAPVAHNRALCRPGRRPARSRPAQGDRSR